MEANSQPAESSEHIARASVDDLRRNALEHYDKVSSAAHEWMNIIPQAINEYYDRRAAPQPATSTVPERPDTYSPNARWCSVCTQRVGRATFHLPPVCADLVATPKSRFQFALETCDLNHDYAFIVGQPKPRCPWCLAQGLERARAAIFSPEEAAAVMKAAILARLWTIQSERVAGETPEETMKIDALLSAIASDLEKVEVNTEALGGTN